ncbi:MAG: GntR family transcriptional regulator [Chloroflexota bacterium]
MANGANRTNGPLHERLRREIQEQIRRGHWTTGDRLPSERALAETYKVSIITVRRALRDLVLEGVLVRRVPAGTFVAGAALPRRVLGVATYGALAMTSPFFGSMLAGVHQGLPAGADLRLLAPARGAAPPLGDWLKALAAAGELAGVVVVTAEAVRHEDVAYLDLVGFPYVLLNRRIEGHAAWCAVLDDYGVGRQAVDYLYALGHRRLAHLAGPPSVITAADRLRGFLDGLRAHCLFDPSDPAEPLVYHGRFTYDLLTSAADQSGYDGMRQLLARDPGITGVFAASDSLASGACRALREAGRRVPEDVSVIGMANNPAAPSGRPAITAFDYRTEELGRQAVALLMNQIEGRVARGDGAAGPAARMRVLEPVLVEGRSCAPACVNAEADVAAGG